MQILNIHDLSVIEIAGLLSLSYIFVYRPIKFTLKWLLNNFSRASKRILKPGPEDFAVVTGASDGIGLEYARQLAEKGYNLLLISRTEEKLKRVAGEIQGQYLQCKKVEILAVDFSRTDIYDRIKQKLESLSGPIHVLVNNVGMANHIPEYFANYPDGFHLRLINTNVVSVTLMSEIVLRIMRKQDLGPEGGRNPAKGVIINISSTAGTTAIPLFSTYCASKAYMNFLSKIISYEYAQDHIIVQTVTPNQVDTKLAKDLANATLSVTPASYVSHALSTVGVEQQTNGHPKHKFINSAMEWLEWVFCDSTFMGVKFNVSRKLRADYESRTAQDVPESVSSPRDPLLNNNN